MPIYEYKCNKCGKQFEAFQGIMDPELKSCKFCKGKVQKMVSLSSFSLKGSGWYATDYKGKKPGAAAQKAKAESSESSSATETAKTESAKTSSEE
ncbi:MAG TPA: zinc ribbon domain-containing protein [Smithella sp.]|nr:zinc ribbon domain-containing protein [Smithella sp.]MDM7988447.1 zinc ribbon domain-containing protein [Smithella sp.]HNY50398.1 zinc ribbon domain-containing protein [Smithella sp.]HOG88995.1 zinc ribbon domain-containing protein [Smithella sp.]HOU50935.1 zinc ribbon domain-containing protein [Smithella sp.]